MKHHTHYFANGSWRPATGGASIDIVNPATEGVIGSAPDCSVEDADAAVAAASQAFPRWNGMAVEERASLLERLKDRLQQRAPELAAMISSEVGTPIKISQRMQVPLPIGELAQTGALARTYAFTERRGNSLVVKEGIGVVACITPWNYPLYQIMTKVAPALAAGCTVVLKPAEVAPSVAFALAEEVEACGFPPGVFNLVTGRGAQVGERLASHAAVDMVSFTGSTAVGKRVAALAAGTVKRVALELGGKSAAVLLDDANFDVAIRNTVNVCFLNSGQTCSALTRLLVPASRYAEAAQRAVAAAEGFAPGDPADERTRLGPLVSASQRERVRGFIRRAKRSADLLIGGEDAPQGLEKGFYVRPTVFGQVRPDSELGQEEVFGPVLAVIPYATEDEAIAIANGTPYGLAAAVWSEDAARALGVARHLRAGQVDVNGAPFNPTAPFGGYRQSGNGRERGPAGLEEFLETKSIQVPVA
jgi:acyl-CoA reductase-like NAD-dependent aldehyde dehydrogenase